MLLLKMLVLLVCALLILFCLALVLVFIPWILDIEISPEDVADFEEKEERK